jgi:MFS family permease
VRPGFLATRRARTVALVFALNGFLFANWFARIPAVKAELGLSDAALGLALLGLPVGALAVMSVTGWIVARLGAGRVTLVASALFCLSIPLPALATDALTLAMALTALGAANGAMDIAMNAEAALVEQDAGRSILIGFHAM